MSDHVERVGGDVVTDTPHLEAAWEFIRTWFRDFEDDDDLIASWTEQLFSGVVGALQLTEEWGTGDGGRKPIQTGWDEPGARAWEARRKNHPWVRLVSPWVVVEEPAAVGQDGEHQ